ncbi:hypothetical protein [Aequorivita marina]|uniref:hypothetical protein n=1 Tax=Aequorivita marina TaxID=3073654 RepID=UPI002875088D|nr:hypothetical protein [Aequorivita sp. S2608]MDS1297908.1 hypothetical protein [Aequorivita sp. S2608]
MKFNHTIFKNSGFLTKLMLFLGVFVLSSQSETWAQTKEYASSQENGRNRATIVLGGISGGYNPTNGTSVANVENPDNAVDGNESTHATMIAKNISILLVDFSGEAWLQMNYANQLNANTTTYIKIDEPTATGFNLDLLETVGGLLGLLDENIIISEVYDGNTMVSPSNVHSTMARDEDGQLYLAVTSSEAYTGVRLKLRSQSNLLGISLGGGLELNVYDAFHINNAPSCGAPLYTYYEDSGLNVELLDFNNQNLENAIDNDTDTYSLVKSGALLGIEVTGSMAQNFNFESESTETSTLNIKLALGSGGVINTDLLGSIQVILYDANGQEVYNQALQSSLLNNTDVLNLLGTGAPATLTFAPGKAFSRAEVKLNSVIGVNLLGNGVRIYDVQRFDGIGTCINPEIAEAPTPTQDPFEASSCATDLVDFENVDFPHNAVDGNNETYTTLHADSGNLLVSGPSAGFVKMDLGAISADETTYVRIDYDEDVLDRLLGGSLGKLVSDLGDGLLLGNQYIQVQAFDANDNEVLDESSQNFFGGSNGGPNGRVIIVEDNIGRYYLAIKPNSDYNSIQITNHVSAVLPTGKQSTLHVYNACVETGTDPCFEANFTSYTGTGIGLSLGDLSEAGVTYPYKAISENSSDYSKINLGIAGVAASVYQSVYFAQPSQTEDHVQIRLAIEPSSALSLDLLGTYKIKFFNGTTQVGPDYNLQDGLLNNIDLLALFNSGGSVTLDFEPTGTFDRVDIGIESLVGLNVNSEPLRVYDVSRYGATCPLTSTPFPFEEPSCSATLIASKNADDVQNLFDDDFDSYATLKSGAGLLFGFGNKFEGYVEMGYDQPVSAGTTSYIRIDFEETILEGLVGGSLGNIVSGLLDGLVLGDHFFIVEVKDENGGVINSASSNQASAGGDDAIRVVQDAAGRYYIAVTPTQDYKSVKITDATNSALGLLSQPNTMNVYGMCTDLVTDPCFGAFATSYEHEGLSLSVNDLGGAGVTNGTYAINENSTNYSEISNGTLGIGASTKQWIFFNSVSNEYDVAVIKFKTQGGGVNLDLLGGLEIKAYLGNTEVAEFDFQNGIINGVNILNLLNNNETVMLNFRPGLKYDRISIGIKTLVQASVFPPIQLFGVDRLCSDGDLITNPMIYQKVD